MGMASGQAIGYRRHKLNGCRAGMGETQVLEDAISAGLTARAIEPNAGEVGPGHTHESACLNCGTPLVGRHCHNCGQAAHVHRTLAAFFHDLLHGVFHFEGKIWRTVPMLAISPGRLTREYIDGRRASYVSPLALFLFSVFLLFAVIQSASGETRIAEEDQIAIKVDAGKTAANARKELPALRARRAQMAARGDDTDDIDMEISSREKVAAVMTGVASGEKIKSTGFSLLDDVVNEASTNPNLALYKMKIHAYKYSWALIPISVPFLWILFPFSRRFHFYDHTVFVTYSLSFMTLLTAAITVAGTMGASGTSALMGIVPPIHMYRQLRGAYGVSRLGGFLRTTALTLFAFLALLIFAMGIAAEAGAG